MHRCFLAAVDGLLVNEASNASYNVECDELIGRRKGVDFVLSFVLAQTE